MLINTLKSVFSNLGYKNLTMIDSGTAIANYLSTKTSLTQKFQTNNIIDSNDKFYITDTSHQFNELANRFLGEKIPNIQLISL